MAACLDEGIRTELATVVAGRGLSSSAAGWLARALVGAVRPNRDLPLLDLARALAALARRAGGRDLRALLRVVFDPALARPGALQALLADEPGATATGIALPGWDHLLPYGALARSLALAELLALVDESALLADLVEALRRVAADPGQPSVEDAARALARALHGWRMRRLPFAALERGLRRIAAAGLDPARARPAAIQAHVEAALGAAPEGAVLPSPERPVPYGLMARSLALAELLALVDGSTLLPDLVEALRRVAADPSPASVEDAARALARALHAWRMRRLPFAAVERGLRRLAAAGLDATPGDEAILDLFRAEIAAGERPVFHALARLVATLERARRHGLDLRRLADALPLDAAPTHAEAALADISGADEASLEERLDRVPARPKCLTGVERRALQAVAALDPLHRARPLTALRAIAFEPVQAGILNRQRRGAGGAGVAARAACGDALPYPEIEARTRELASHLRDLLRIALVLRLDDGGERPADPRAAAALAEGRRLLKSMRRDGFDAEPQALRAAFAGMDGDLAALAEALDEMLRALDALAAGEPLERRFEADRAAFAALFSTLYADDHPQEASDGAP